MLADLGPSGLIPLRLSGLDGLGGSVYVGIGGRSRAPSRMVSYTAYNAHTASHFSRFFALFSLYPAWSKGL